MNFVSVCNKEELNNNILLSELHDPQFVSKLKSHWKNGVRMFAEHGQRKLNSQNGVVCASIDGCDHERLFEEYKHCPNNTILFLTEYPISHRIEHRYHHLSRNMFPDTDTFVAEYSTFMKFTCYWKTITEYYNHSNLIQGNDKRSILNSMLFDNSLQYKVLDRITNTIRYN